MVKTIAINTWVIMTPMKGIKMYIHINKELVVAKLKHIAKPAAYVVTALVVIAGVAVMVERFSRKADGSHDLSI